MANVSVTKTARKPSTKTAKAQTEALNAETAALAVAATEAPKAEAKPVKEPRVTKRSVAIALMNEHKDKPMAEVCALIGKANDVTDAAARSYYRYLVENKMAEGVVVKSERKPGEPRKAGEYEVRPTSKRAKAIEVMKANADKPMAEVLPLIAAAAGVPDSNARSYYRYLSENGFAPGVVTKAAPKAKAEKTGKAASAKPAEPTRTPEEIQAAKDANKAKFKALAEAKKTKVAA